MRNLGERIKQARLKERISQKALADAIGRKQVSISNIEKGESEPSLNQLKKIADVLGVSMIYLFDENTESTIEPVPKKIGGAVVIEKNGVRVELPIGTTPDFITEVIKKM